MGKKDKKLQEAIDSGAYGRPLEYDANFLGPRAKRSCTDIICLLLFVCFVVAWIVVGAIAFKQGDPAKVIAPVDSYGRRCGIDAGVENEKHLFYFDITSCSATTGQCDTPLVCVSQCPREVYVGMYLAITNLTHALKGAICREEMELETHSDLAKAINQRICAAWYIPTRSVGQRCIFVRKSDIENDPLVEALLEEVGITMDKIMEEIQIVQTVSQLRKIGETILSDLKRIWPLLVGALGIAMILSLIFIVIMRWFAWIIVWFSLIGVLALLGYCCYAAWIKYQEAVEADRKFDSVESIFALKATWLILFIVSCVLSFLVLIIIIFLRNRIRIAIALISEGSRAVGSITSTLFFPLIPWLIQIGIIAWTVAIWVYLAASGLPVHKVQGLDNDCKCGSLSNGDSCEPKVFNEDCKNTIKECGNAACAFINYESRSYTDYLHAFNIIGFFWVLCFVSAFSDMALAGTFSTWYWTFNKSDVPFFTLTYSIGRTMRYHLGTLAFGSLILAICRLIRVVLEFINAKLKKFDNCLVRSVLCCMRCFFWCLEKFIIFINRNAYIMCAIHGKNFCRSARKAFNLLMRNILRVFVLDKVTDFLFFLGKLLITGAMVALAYYVFSQDLTVDEDENIPEFTYYLLPVILVGLGTYFVTSIFFSVYAMAVDTLFLCFLEDLERNDGSTEKPYYMSKKLMRILGKKNKKYKERVE